MFIQRSHIATVLIAQNKSCRLHSSWPCVSTSSWNLQVCSVIRQETHSKVSLLNKIMTRKEFYWLQSSMLKKPYFIFVFDLRYILCNFSRAKDLYMNLSEVIWQKFPLFSKRAPTTWSCRREPYQTVIPVAIFLLAGWIPYQQASIITVAHNHLMLSHPQGSGQGILFIS